MTRRGRPAKADPAARMADLQRALFDSYMKRLAARLMVERHGVRGALVRIAACDLGVSPATVYRIMKELALPARQRKRRSDAGRRLPAR